MQAGSSSTGQRGGSSSGDAFASDADGAEAAQVAADMARIKAQLSSAAPFAVANADLVAGSAVAAVAARTRRNGPGTQALQVVEDAPSASPVDPHGHRRSARPSRCSSRTRPRSGTRCRYAGRPRRLSDRGAITVYPAILDASSSGSRADNGRNATPPPTSRWSCAYAPSVRSLSTIQSRPKWIFSAVTTSSKVQASTAFEIEMHRPAVPADEQVEQACAGVVDEAARRRPARAGGDAANRAPASDRVRPACCCRSRAGRSASRAARWWPTDAWRARRLRRRPCRARSRRARCAGPRRPCGPSGSWSKTIAVLVNSSGMPRSARGAQARTGAGNGADGRVRDGVRPQALEFGVRRRAAIVGRDGAAVTSRTPAGPGPPRAPRAAGPAFPKDRSRAGAWCHSPAAGSPWRPAPAANRPAPARPPAATTSKPHMPSIRKASSSDRSHWPDRRRPVRTQARLGRPRCRRPAPGRWPARHRRRPPG